MSTFLNDSNTNGNEEMICLHIDIHGTDGNYCATERRWYNTEGEIPNRLQVVEGDFILQNLIESGYIIGNVFTTNSVKKVLKYCKEIDESYKDMEVEDLA